MSATLAAGTAQDAFASTLTVTFPGGAAAGNLVIITVGARWNFTALPSGWTVADANDGSFFNGRTIWKVLTSGDVATGSATINFGGSSSLACVALLITGTTATPTVGVRSTQRWGGGGSALLAAQPSNSFSAATGSLMVYAGVNDSSTAMTISRGSQAGSADIATAIVAHANSEVLAAPLSSTTATFNSASATSAYYVVLEVADSPDATVTPPAATATAAAVVPVVSASRVVLPPAATASAAALPPTIGAGGNATVSPPAATATATALAPTITQIIPAGTDTSNSLNGRRRRARASVVVTRPAAAVPSRAAVKYDKSVPYPPPTLVDGRPT